MIVLDGNRRKLCASPGLGAHACEAEWQAQLSWLREELEQVDQAPAHEQYGALLFVHQSPYTQSPVGRGRSSRRAGFRQRAVPEQAWASADLRTRARLRTLCCIAAIAVIRDRPRRSSFRRAAAGLVPVGGVRGRPRTYPSSLGRARSTTCCFGRMPDAVHVDVRGLEKGRQLVVPLSDENDDARVSLSPTIRCRVAAAGAATAAAKPGRVLSSRTFHTS